jgi:hypothetical protein
MNTNSKINKIEIKNSLFQFNNFFLQPSNLILQLPFGFPQQHKSSPYNPYMRFETIDVQRYI